MTFSIFISITSLTKALQSVVPLIWGWNKFNVTGGSLCFTQTPGGMIWHNSLWPTSNGQCRFTVAVMKSFMTDSSCLWLCSTQVGVGFGMDNTNCSCVVDRWSRLSGQGCRHTHQDYKCPVSWWGNWVYGLQSYK